MLVWTNILADLYIAFVMDVVVLLYIWKIIFFLQPLPIKVYTSIKAKYSTSKDTI